MKILYKRYIVALIIAVSLILMNPVMATNTLKKNGTDYKTWQDIPSCVEALKSIDDNGIVNRKKEVQCSEDIERYHVPFSANI